MTRKQIEKAALLFAGAGEWGECPYNPDAKTGFMAGAEWRINSVWHNASEKPDKNQLVVFECRKTYGKGYSVNFGENYLLLKNVLLSWAYIKDLIPERKEETE